jgi:hypothetical protein
VWPAPPARPGPGDGEAAMPLARAA